MTANNPYRKCPVALALSIPAEPSKIDLVAELRRVLADLEGVGYLSYERHKDVVIARSVGALRVICAGLPPGDKQ